MSDLHLRLTLDLKYTLNGNSPRYLKMLLDDLVGMAKSEGMFTNESSAELDDLKQEIVVIST